jgi:hypothetical protein
MAAAALVGLELESGSRVISILEDAGIVLKVALWMTTPEFEEGRVVIASPSLDQSQPLRAYEMVAKILHGKFNQAAPPILILRMRDPFVQKLRQLFGKTASVDGMRLGGQTIGNRFVLDAYVYRIQ